jgi:uncharacterized YigZ family protein
MTYGYLIPAAETRVESKVANSRFIATAAPVFSVDEAKTFVGRIRAEFSDATHNVPAYIVGYGASVISHCSDDGEPPATAGRPVLAVLQGSGLGDVAVVVTRYFGGAKLGTGGLVRAYGDAVREVLVATPRAAKVATHTVMFEVPYSLLERVRLLIAAQNGRILDEAFAVNILISAQFLVEHFPAFAAALRELSQGQIEAMIIKSNEDTIMPVQKMGENPRQSA